MRNRSSQSLFVLAVAAALAGCSETKPEAAADLPAHYRPDFHRGMHVYNVFCGDCHDYGENNAPMLDDPDDWNPRVMQFPSVLANHANKGFLDMPKKGGHPELTEEMVYDAVYYMVSQIMSEEDE
jgi:cytochrome c5